MSNYYVGKYGTAYPFTYPYHYGYPYAPDFDWSDAGLMSGNYGYEFGFGYGHGYGGYGYFGAVGYPYHDYPLMLAGVKELPATSEAVTEVSTLLNR